MHYNIVHYRSRTFLYVTLKLNGFKMSKKCLSSTTVQLVKFSEVTMFVILGFNIEVSSSHEIHAWCGSKAWSSLSQMQRETLGCGETMSFRDTRFPPGDETPYTWGGHPDTVHLRQSSFYFSQELTESPGRDRNGSRTSSLACPPGKCNIDCFVTACNSIFKVTGSGSVYNQNSVFESFGFSIKYF